VRAVLSQAESAPKLALDQRLYPDETVGTDGLETRWRLHDLRHWSATLAIGSGHDLRTVANRLGHANPAMTLRVYAHALDIADQAVAQTLGAALDEGDG